MAQKITNEKALSIADGFNQVLRDHNVTGHSIAKFSLKADEGLAPEDDICPGQKPCFDQFGNCTCVDFDVPC
jgi:hypothetical protein